jgi:hypothetical protein
MLPADAHEVLGEFLGANADDDGPEEEAFFGTTGKKVVGDTWPVNKATMARSFNKGANGLLTLKEENVSGMVKFSNVGKEGGVTYLDFDADITLNFNMPPQDVGNGAIMSATGSATLRASCRMPADYSTGAVRTSYKMDMKMEMTIQVQGQVIKGNATITENKSTTLKYLSGGGKDPDGGKKPRAMLPQRLIEGMPRLEMALVDWPIGCERSWVASRG